MERMSPQAEKILETFREATEPTAHDHEAAWSKFQANLRTSHVVTRAEIRRHRVRWLWRGVLRGVFLGGLLAGFWFLADRGVDEMASRNLLTKTRAYLDAGRPDHAYRLLVRHAKQHPTRSAAEDRMPLVLDALCDMDMEPKARRQLEDFLDQVPDSVHASRLSEVCPGGLSPKSPLPSDSRGLRSNTPLAEAKSADASKTSHSEEAAAQGLQEEGVVQIEEAPMVISPEEGEPTRFFSTLEGPITPSPSP